MKTREQVIRQVSELEGALAALAAIGPNFVTVFGAVSYFEDPAVAGAICRAFPDAVVVGCSTAGEISNDGVSDGSLTLVGTRFEQTRLRPAVTAMAGMADSQAAGERIGELLKGDGLRAVFVLGPGVDMNGSALVDGMASRLGAGVPITGGLAGDGGAFRRTFTLSAQGASDRAVVAVGFYGDGLRYAHGSFGGWEAFGPARKVTRCEGNILYELDGEPALEVYKRYLGEHAKGLPASGLLFPFAMLGQDHDAVGLIRTILGVDEAGGSLTLAGEIDPDGYLKLMHASTDKLVDGAEAAADAAAKMQRNEGASLALLVSCVGRKLVMGDRVDEEVEAVGDVFGAGATLTGFYSYGEISPFAPGVSCQLHNQTMTVTWLGE